MNAVVVLAGEFRSTPAIERALRSADLVVAADGGADHLAEWPGAPDLLVGDMDSITPNRRAELQDRGVELLRFPEAKDATDGELALLAGVDRGATAITILAGWGGPRADHGLANLLLLAHRRLAGVNVRFLTDTTEVRALRPGKHEVGVKPGETISLVPVTATVRGITITGVRWPLEDVDLELGSTYTVSNVATGPVVAVSIGDGIVLFFRDLNDDQTAAGRD